MRNEESQAIREPKDKGQTMIYKKFENSNVNHELILILIVRI